MALTNNPFPTTLPTRALPVDVLQQFSDSNRQSLTSSGYVNNSAYTSGQIGVGIGRFDGYWALNIAAIDFSSADESYRLFLLGSNDVAFGNGNVDILATRDFAASSSGRLLPTIGAASPALSAPAVYSMPFSNHAGPYVFQYLRLYAALAGTTPSITLSSWVVPIRA